MGLRLSFMDQGVGAGHALGREVGATEITVGKGIEKGLSERERAWGRMEGVWKISWFVLSVPYAFVLGPTGLLIFWADLVGPQCLTGGNVHWIRLPSPLLHSLADVDGEGQPAEELINLADGETARAEIIPAAASRRRGIVVKR